MLSWKQYYAEHTKGKKFSGTEIREHMKKLSADYRKMKSTEGKGMCEEVEVEKPDDVSCPSVSEEPEMDGGAMKPKRTRRIDFSKIHWGAFTKDWKSMGKSHKTLEEFATHVLKSQKQFEPIVVKRARFYKNIILKGKGLGML